ncbi:MAG: hypothetical protein RR827_03935 [Oscillospiraceae bacterium]
MKILEKVKFLEKITEKQKGNVVIFLGILGILFILMGDFKFFKNDDGKDKSPNSLAAYKRELERETAVFLKEIEGVGDVKVMITLESGEEIIYAQEEKNVEDKQKNSSEKALQESIKSTFENAVVMVGSSGEKTALVEKTVQPAIQGVAVVCQGADDVSVVSAVTNSIAVVLNVPTHKICVTKMR